MRRLPQSTAYTVMLKLYLSSDHIAPATGKTVPIVISKNGGAFANPAAGSTNATEISDGWYKVALGAGDTDTLGDLVVRGTCAACDPTEQLAQVVKATNGGMTALPDAVAEAAGGLFTRGAGAGQINQGSVGQIDSRTVAMVADVITATVIAPDAIGASELAADAATEIRTGLSTLDAVGIRAAVGLVSANTDTQLAAIAAFIDTEVGAIKAKTDNLPSDPADASDIVTAFGTVNTVLTTIAGYLDTEVGAIKAKTDNLTFTSAGKVDANMLELNGDGNSATRLAKATAAIGRGTVGAAATTSVIPTSAFGPSGAAADQFRGRVLTFDADTATAALRGQSTSVMSSTNAATPTLTVEALTTAPANGDTFSLT